jgi:hypothetical protein
MKIMKLSVVAIALTSLVYLAFGSLESLEQKKINDTQTIPSENNKLFKKWTLSHYELFGSDFDPEVEEQEDYVHFHKGGIYSSKSKGVLEDGNYTLAAQTIIMTSNTEGGELKFNIKNLTEEILSVSIDDPEDSDAQYLTIHFKNKK